MSMIGNFRMASDAEIKALLEDPETITDLLYPESDETAAAVSNLTWTRPGMASISCCAVSRGGTIPARLHRWHGTPMATRTWATAGARLLVR